MDEQEVRAEILNLSGEILMGKASREDVERVTKLAKEHNLIPVLRAAFNEIHSALT